MRIAFSILLLFKICIALDSTRVKNTIDTHILDSTNILVLKDDSSKFNSSNNSLKKLLGNDINIVTIDSIENSLSSFSDSLEENRSGTSYEIEIDKDSIADTLRRNEEEDFSDYGDYEIVVVGYKEDSINVIKEPDGAATSRITAKDIEAISQDIFKEVTTVLTTNPEVNTSGDFSAITYVRGTDNIAYYLNGMPIYSPYRWRGYLSIFNTYYINYIDVYTGRVPKMFNGALSGVYDIQYKNSVADTLSGLVELGAESNIYLTVPIGPASFSFGYRRSLYDKFAKLAINEVDIEGNEIDDEFVFPFFDDYYFQGAWNITKNHHVSGSVVLNSESSLTDYGDQIADSSSTVTLDYSWNINKSWNLHALVGRNFHKFNYPYYDYEYAPNHDLQINELVDSTVYATNLFNKSLFFKVEAQYTTQNLTLNSGISNELFRINNYETKNKSIARYNSFVDSSSTQSAYIDGDYSINSIFNVGSSLHLDYISKMVNQNFFITPEFWLGADLKKDGYINAIFSMVSTQPKIFTNDSYFVDYELESENAYHSTVSYERVITKRVMVKSSLQYSLYENMYTPLNGNNEGSSNYKGLSLSLTRKRGAYTRYDGYISYTLGESLYRSSIFGLEKEYPSAFDFRHCVKVGANFTFIRNKTFLWECKNKIVYQSATPYHNIGKTVRTELEEVSTPGEEVIPTEEFSPFDKPDEGIFRWDTGLYFTFPKLVNFTVYVQSINVTSRANVDSYVVDDINSREVTLKKYYSPFASRFFVGGLSVAF